MSPRAGSAGQVPVPGKGQAGRGSSVAPGPRLSLGPGRITGVTGHTGTKILSHLGEAQLYEIKNDLQMNLLAGSCCTGAAALELLHQSCCIGAAACQPWEVAVLQLRAASTYGWGCRWQWLPRNPRLTELAAVLLFSSDWKYPLQSGVHKLAHVLNFRHSNNLAELCETASCESLFESMVLSFVVYVIQILISVRKCIISEKTYIRRLK